jgi:hypothetical protein
MDKKTIVVAGLARCGTSAMMQALHAAGLKCAGEYPSFEDDATAAKYIPNEYFARFEAVKVLDPHYCTFDKSPPIVVLWMSRDFGEQAKSQDKFIRLVMPDAYAAVRGSVSAKRIERKLADETVECARLLKDIPRLTVEFHRLLDIPEEVCEEVAEFLLRENNLSIDPAVMAREIVRRDPACAPDISMELKQLASPRARS